MTNTNLCVVLLVCAFCEQCQGARIREKRAARGTRLQSNVTSTSHTEVQAQSTPEQLYDDNWFSKRCKPGKTTLSTNVFYAKDGGNEWTKFRKCERSSNHSLEHEKAAQTKEQCLEHCYAVAKENPTWAFCCEFDASNELCTAARGWNSLKVSNKGKWFSRKKPKEARLIKAGSSAENLEISKADESEQGQEYLRAIVEQVNHMSLSGITRKLLSFYVCMRWVPDEQFLRAAEFELKNVDVDESTMRNKDADETSAIEGYINFDMVPLKCSSAFHVQDLKNIDVLLQQTKSKTSELQDAYEFSKKVASNSWTMDTFHSWTSTAVRKTRDAMANYVQVEEMIKHVHKVLPWDSFLRPSKKFKESLNMDTHISKPKNQFFLCFGPRVASFPHKRQDADHILADQNMAGCNGLWDMEDLSAHLEQLRLLFAPQTCLVNKFEKQLKEAFIESFVKMNVHFEDMLTGEINLEDDFVRATPKEVRRKILQDSGFYAEVQIANKKRVQKKYKRAGRLLAGAHAKWLICDATDEAVEMEFGIAENKFRTASAYSKWVPEAKEKVGLTCTILDSSTGCLKCITGKFSAPHRCPLEGNVRLTDVWGEVKQKHAPLSSAYHERASVVVKENSTYVKFAKAMGFCLGGLETPRTAFAGNGKFDKIFRVEQVSETGAFSTHDLPPSGLHAPRTLSKCLEEAASVWPHQDQPEQGMWGNTYSAKYTSTDAIGEKAKVEECLDKVEGKYEHSVVHPSDHFGSMFVFEEEVPARNNVEAHYVQYVNVCPCSGEDDTSYKKAFSTFANYEATASSE